MNRDTLKSMLRAYRQGTMEEDVLLEALARLPFQEATSALLDTHRGIRQGFPEVVFGQNKPAEQIEDLIRVLSGGGTSNVLVTRLNDQKAACLKGRFGDVMEWDRDGGIALWRYHDIPISGEGTILVVSAGSSDLKVCREAVFTARAMGNSVQELLDVGVAGLHRLLAHLDPLRQASVVVVVAGMEGALASVVGGLVEVPVIAVPTSVGYGAAFQGLSALLTMLNSCSSAVSVVNIDNGFGAGYVASLINRQSRNREDSLLREDGP